MSELTTTILTGDDVRDLVEQMLKSSGRPGSRPHVVIPDIARQHWQVDVRKFVVRRTISTTSCDWAT